MKTIKPEEMLKAGVHLGHRKSKTNPASKPYIYKMESGTAIIDLYQTQKQLETACKIAHELGKTNKVLLAVTTKKGGKDIVKKYAIENSIHYITSKWIGGFLTNFNEIKKNIKQMLQLKIDKKSGEWEKYVKHEQVKLDKSIQKLAILYDGVENLSDIPDALFIIDTKKEYNAVIEARQKNIITIALVDTNSDPRLIDYPIVGNDDALSSIEYITSCVLEAYAQGKNEFKKAQVKNKK